MSEPQEPGYPEPVYPQQPPAYGPPPGYPPQYYTPPRQLNGLAITSMILGILWIYWLGSILALILGYTARKQIRERNESGDGMAIAGIVLGWIGTATLAIVLTIVIIGLSTNGFQA
jgi:hypothetical protein